MLTRHALKIRPQATPRVGLTRSLLVRPMAVQHRHVWNDSLKRSLTMAAVGGTGLLGLVVMGPFILLGIGGLTAVFAFKFWRFKKQFLANGNEWPGFLNEVFQKQQVFGKEKFKVEGEAVKRLKQWTQSEEGRQCLIEHGIHPEGVASHVSMRGSSFTQINSSKEIKIELDLGYDAVLIALAEMDVEGNVCVTDIKLVTSTGHTIRVPLQNGGGGRVIEGEFRDV